MTPAPVLYREKPEMMWRIDAVVEALRKRKGWTEFHKVCGRANLFFDHIEKSGKRGPYSATAFRLGSGPTHHLRYRIADGTGKTPLDAIVACYKAAGQPVADEELAVLIGSAPPPADDFDDLLGEDVADDFEDIIG